MEGPHLGQPQLYGEENEWRDTFGAVRWRDRGNVVKAAADCDLAVWRARWRRKNRRVSSTKLFFLGGDEREWIEQ